jgi:phenylalanyl-tRNA synthetase beta chain
LRDDSVTTSDQSVKGTRQPLRLAGLAWGPVDTPQWGAPERHVDFFDVKGDVEALFAPALVSFVAGTHPAMHPGRCAHVLVGGEAVGVIGELHPRWRQAYELPSAPVLFELDAQCLITRPVPVFEPVSRLQPVLRDIAVIVADGTSHDEMMATLTAAAPDGLLRQARLFDVYRPTVPTADIAAGERSLAIRLELLDEQSPLTDERSDEIVRGIVQALSTRHGARLRG